MHLYTSFLAPSASLLTIVVSPSLHLCISSSESLRLLLLEPLWSGSWHLFQRQLHPTPCTRFTNSRHPFHLISCIPLTSSLHPLHLRLCTFEPHGYSHLFQPSCTPLLAPFPSRSRLPIDFLHCTPCTSFPAPFLAPFYHTNAPPSLHLLLLSNCSLCKF